MVGKSVWIGLCSVYSKLNPYSNVPIIANALEIGWERRWGRNNHADFRRCTALSQSRGFSARSTEIGSWQVT